MTSASFLRLCLMASIAAVAAIGACGGDVVVGGGSTGTTTTSSGTGGAGTKTGVGGALTIMDTSTAAGYGANYDTSNAGTTTTATSTGFSAATSTVASSGAGGASCPASPVLPLSPCSPGAACAAAGSPCLAEVDQGGSPSFGLRMAQLSVALPTVLATGTLGNILSNSVTPAEPACNLEGTGTFSWLLQLDTTQGTMLTGAAKPATGTPYYFFSGTITYTQGQFSVAPATLTVPFQDCAIDSSAADLNLPVFLDGSTANPIVLPLHALQFYKGPVNSDHSCIGYYNPSALSLSDDCQPGPGTQAWANGGSVNAYLPIALTDLVDVPQLAESLCVLLSANPMEYGDGATPIQHCKTGPGNTILFQGDWCSTTNGPATPTCSDSLQFAAGFAASGVTIQ